MIAVQTPLPAGTKLTVTTPNDARAVRLFRFEPLTNVNGTEAARVNDFGPSLAAGHVRATPSTVP
jgi:hypothetical protein